MFEFRLFGIRLFPKKQTEVKKRTSKKVLKLFGLDPIVIKPRVRGTGIRETTGSYVAEPFGLYTPMDIDKIPGVKKYIFENYGGEGKYQKKYVDSACTQVLLALGDGLSQYTGHDFAQAVLDYLHYNYGLDKSG